MGYKGGYIVGFFNPPEKIVSRKYYTNEWNCYSMLKYVMKETGPEVDHFAGFCHHCLMTMSALTHAYT